MIKMVYFKKTMKKSSFFPKAILLWNDFNEICFHDSPPDLWHNLLKTKLYKTDSACSQDKKFW